MSRPCYVYSIDNTGHRLVLTQHYKGTRAACRALIRARARNGGHTATTFVSILGYDAAERRYLKGWN